MTDEYGDIAIAEPMPRGGWDKPRDVEEAKRFMLATGGALNNSKSDSKALMEIGSRMFKLGISPKLCVHLIATIQKPPVSEEAIRLGIEEAYEFNQDLREEPGTESLVGTSDELDWPEAEEEFDFESPASPYAREWPFSIDYGDKRNAAQNAEMFLSLRPSKLISSAGVFYTLEHNKIWRELSADELAAEVRMTDPQLKLDVDRVLKIIKALRMACFTKAMPFEWIAEPGDAPAPADLVLFQNGILNFSSTKLIPHSGRLFVTGLPAYDFDAAARCPLWMKCLDDWLHPSFHATLQEFMGYMLTSSTAYEVLLVMIGATRSGKGTITHIMQKLAGPDLFVSRTMNDLAGEFGLECATDKRFIFIPDAGDTDPQKRGVVLERIKSITGNDVLSVNRKNKQIVNAKLAAKIILVCNRHPKLLDDSSALAARELPIIFSKSFLGKEDRELRSKLEAELSGIANWALEGLDRLRENDRFTVGELGKAAARELAESQSPALRFAKEHLVVTGNPDYYVPLPAVYHRYAEWADFAEGLSGRERRNRNDFKLDLISALGSRGVEHCQRRWHDPLKSKTGKGTPKRGFFGIQLKPERGPESD